MLNKLTFLKTSSLIIGLTTYYIINNYLAKLKKLKFKFNENFIQITNHSNYNITNEHLSNFKPFCEYPNNLYLSNGLIGSNYGKLLGIEILEVTIINERILFMYLKVNILDISNNSLIPGMMFLRPNTIGILVTDVDQDGEEHILIVKQPRIAGARITEEIPAGMMESNDKEPSGRAIIELKEETGIIIKRTELSYLGSFEPSIGGCNEKFDIYHCKHQGMIEKIKETTHLTFGKSEEQEYIKKSTPKIKDVINDPDFKDGKSILAIQLYLQKK